MKRVKMIERAGVNIYELGNLPLAIQKGEYSFVVDF